MSQHDCSLLSTNSEHVFLEPKPPNSRKDIAESVVYYGNFLVSLQYMIDFFNAETSSSVILRGNIGTGKKTLLKEAKRYSKSVIYIHINPFHCTDDFTALKHIAKKLNIEIRPSLQDIMFDIQEKSTEIATKIIIVLLDFERFCRGKQSLLYCLTNLIQHTNNIGLIGTTLRLDCTESLEKRVRSRLNAHFHELKHPYSNKQEYFDFASKLLGNHKLSEEIKSQLIEVYEKNKSIRPLKSFLIQSACWNKKRVFSLRLPDTLITNQSNLKRRFGWLTWPQQELLKLTVSYCNENDCSNFTLRKVVEFSSKRNYSLDIKSDLAIKNVSLLAKISFFRMKKMTQTISDDTEFALSVAPLELKLVIEKNPEVHRIRTDPLWKKWHI